MSAEPTSEELVSTALVGLLRASHRLPPSDFGSAVAEHARTFGALETVLYRADYQQTHLQPLPSAAAADRRSLAIDATLPGRTFITGVVLEGDADVDQPAQRRLWVPVLDGTERMGLLELTFETGGGAVSEPVRGAAVLFASLVAELAISKNLYGDVFEFVRRRKELSVAAEVQWHLLPPLTFSSDHVVVTGIVEPSESVAGDSFDYAINGSTTHVAIFDAVGHGLRSGMLASIAVGAYRNARRRLLDLTETHRWIDETVETQSEGERFVTALLAELDLATGTLTWLSAGHPAPLLLRGTRLVGSLDAVPVAPLGLGLDGPPTLAHAALEPGDRVLFYTDGVVEARDVQGQFFGVDRLADFIIRESASGYGASEVLRRLARAVLAHVSHRLSDDATIVMLEWRGA